ncbi:hypothetical protein Tco_0397189 [Tanacetum coccineum]
MAGIYFSQGPIYQPQVNQPPAYQAPVYQASIPQTQGVSKTDFDSYVKANDAVMRNMQNQNQVLQNQGQNLQAQLNNLATSNQRVESMLSNFIKMNTASTSGSGTLPGNTITNPKEDLKVIRGYKDTMLPTNNGSTEDVQPPVVQVQSQNPTSEPDVDPVSAPRPNQQTSIPFPSRRNDERRREKANDQIEKFYEIFRDLSFEISFTDALTLMPKFASTLKTLIGNKEKLSEMARTPLNENCSAVIQSSCINRVYEGKITLRVGKEAITFNLDQTSRYTANYDHMTANRIDVIELACEEYSQEVLAMMTEQVFTGTIDAKYYDPWRVDILISRECTSQCSEPLSSSSKS